VAPDNSGAVSAAQAFEEEILAAFCRDTGLKPEIARPFVKPFVDYLIAEYGGGRMYVPARSLTYRLEEIGKAFAESGDVDRVCQDFEISRATLYRLLGRKTKR
jgi:hypothetical protein